jgi:hypothetical protein
MSNFCSKFFNKIKVIIVSHFADGGKNSWKNNNFRHNNVDKINFNPQKEDNKFINILEEMMNTL